MGNKSSDLIKDLDDKEVAKVIHLPTLKGKKKVDYLLSIKNIKHKILDYVVLNNIKMFEECLIDLEQGGSGEPDKHKFNHILLSPLRRRRKSFIISPEEAKEHLKQLQTSMNIKRSSKAINECELPPIEKRYATQGVNVDEDLGFSNPNEESKQKMLDLSLVSSESIEEEQKEAPDYYDDDYK